MLINKQSIKGHYFSGLVYITQNMSEVNYVWAALGN